MTADCRHPSNTANSRRQLSSWGLPPPILAAFHKKDLKELFPWQAAALECAAAGNNLVYCAPTSGGKSLVADVLMLSRLHRCQQQAVKAAAHKGRRPQQQPTTRALIVLPYLSIVSEKTHHLGTLLQSVRWRVMGYQGDDADGQPLTHPAERVSICSIEKANGAINRLIQEQRLHELVSVTIDEAHMLADPNRGAALEMLLSKLMATRGRSAIQIVAMSATMSGLDSLSEWLDAHLFLTNFRPVPLTEHAVFEGCVYMKTDPRHHQQGTGGDCGEEAQDQERCILQQQRDLETSSSSSDKDTLVTLVAEVVAERQSVLVFCAGRAAAQSCAAMLSEVLPQRLGPPDAAAAAARADLVEQLRVALSGSTDAAFERLLVAGVAYHHAGLTSQERAIVEQGFSSGAILVLTATSTLAAGVNLPARRVILRSLWQGVGDVSRAQYLQMVGRAGRAGHAAVGDAYLMAKGPAHSSTGQWRKVCELLAAPLPVLRSQLVQPEAAAAPQSQGVASHGSLDQQQKHKHKQQSSDLGAAAVHSNAQHHLQHLLLDAVATGLVTTGDTVLQLLKSTLAYFHVPFSSLADAAKVALTALRARKLISLKPDGPEGPSHWELTALGSAVVASALDPQTGLLLHGRLSNMLTCTVLSGNLHLLYVLQPDPLLTIFDWGAYLRLRQELSPEQRRVAEVEGLDTSYVNRRMAGLMGNAVGDAQHARFAAAVLLDRLVMDASSIHGLELTWGKLNYLTRTGISRGVMQRWQTEVSKTAAMAALLAGHAGWWQLETLLAPLAVQVAAGVRPELLSLMKIPGMQPSQAAALHAAGLSHPDLLLGASEAEVAAALAAALPNNRPKRKHADSKGLGSKAGTHAMAARAACMVLSAARQHAVMTAAMEATADGDEQQSQPPAARTKVLVGQAVIHQIWPTKDDPLLPRLLDTWQLQTSFALAVVTAPVGRETGFQHTPQVAAFQGPRPGSGGPGSCGECLQPGGLPPSLPHLCHEKQTSAAPVAATQAAPVAATQAAPAAAAGEPDPQQGVSCRLGVPVPIALALCWSDKEAALLHLPPLRTGSSDAHTSCRSRHSSSMAAFQTHQHSELKQPAAAVAAAAVAAAAAPWSITALDAGGTEAQPSSSAGAAAPEAGSRKGTAGDVTADWVWGVIDDVLGDSQRTAVCMGAAGALAALSNAGVRVQAAVDDPCVAFLLWQPKGLQEAATAATAAGQQRRPESSDTTPTTATAATVDEVSRAAAAVVLSGTYKLQVPVLPGSNGSSSAAATAAVKAVLLARALMPPLRTLLAKQQLTSVYEPIEVPVMRATASVQGHCVNLDCYSLRHDLARCQWQLALVEQQTLRLIHDENYHQQHQQQQQQPFGSLQMMPALHDSGIRLLLRQRQMLNISSDKLQSEPLVNLLQRALCTAVQQKQTNALPLLRLLLTHCVLQQHLQELQALWQVAVQEPYRAGSSYSCPLSDKDLKPQAGKQLLPMRDDSRCCSGHILVLQAQAGMDPVSGQLRAGWMLGFKDVLGFCKAPAVPVLMSAASLAAQQVTTLQLPLAVVAVCHPGPAQQQQQQQQQQRQEKNKDGATYMTGLLCAVAAAPAALDVHKDSRFASITGDGCQLAKAVPAANTWGERAPGSSSNAAQSFSSHTLSLKIHSCNGQQLQQGDAAARVDSVGSVRVRCSFTGRISEVDLSTRTLHCISCLPAIEHQQASLGCYQPHQQQQQQQQQEAGNSTSTSFLPCHISMAALIRPSHPSHTFVGVRMEGLSLLALAVLSQDKTLLVSCSRPDPLAAAAVAWLPSSGLPTWLLQDLLENIQAGVLGGVPVSVAAAPGLLFAVALQALIGGFKPSVQRQQLGVKAWPQGVCLAEAVVRVWPGVNSWRLALLEQAKNKRYLHTLLGRKIPFRLPELGLNPTKAAAKERKEAERLAVSLVLTACIGDLQRFVLAAVQRTCAALHTGSQPQNSSGRSSQMNTTQVWLGGDSQAQQRGAGGAAATVTAAGASTAAGTLGTQGARDAASAAAAAVEPAERKEGSRPPPAVTQPHFVAHGVQSLPDSGVPAAGFNTSVSQGLGLGSQLPRAGFNTSVSQGLGLGSQVPGETGLHSSASPEGSAASLASAFVVVADGQQVVLEAPAALALPVLRACRRQVVLDVAHIMRQQRPGVVLGEKGNLQDPAADSSRSGSVLGSSSLVGTGRVGGEEAAAGESVQGAPGGDTAGALSGLSAEVEGGGGSRAPAHTNDWQLRFRWWWGASLDLLQANFVQ